jgi:hypothetical protein
MSLAFNSTFMPVVLGQPYLREAQEVRRTVDKISAER